MYKAVDTASNRIVALKVLAPHLTWDKGFVTRFEREAKTMASLRHPNIVAIHEVGEAYGKHYIAMDYLEGRTLKQLIDKEGALPLERAIHIIEQLASALDYAHETGVVHRDIKPSNIIIGPDEHVTLTDFGIVKATVGTRLTSTGVTLGTPEYMSPEQGQGLDVDRRSDIYSLGVVLYEMLTGKVPFPGTTPLAVLHKHVCETASALRALNPCLPHWVEAVVGKALAKDPKARFSTAGEMATAVSEGEEVSATVAVQAIREPSRQRRTLPIGLWAPALAAVLVILAITAAAVLKDHFATPMSGPTTIPLAALASHTPTETAAPRPSATQAQTSPTIATPTAQPSATLVAKPSPTPTASPTPVPTRTPVPPTPLPSPEVDLYPGMIFIPAGEFTMGSERYGNERPVHEVYLDPFYVDKYEVTNADYRQCVEVGVCEPPAETSSYTRDSYYGSSQYDDYPVVWVSWYDARTYCQWVDKRLPTEAEWEKAARGTDGRIYPWGDGFDSSNCNCSESGIGDTTWVGQYSPQGDSPYGVADMAGNVYEWVADWYDEGYYGREADRNPQGPSSGQYKVARGGSWRDNRNDVRCPDRGWCAPDFSFYHKGFRCARGSH